MHGKRHGEDQSEPGASDIIVGNNLPELLLRWRAWVARCESNYSSEIFRPDKRPWAFAIMRVPPSCSGLLQLEFITTSRLETDTRLARYQE